MNPTPLELELILRFIGEHPWITFFIGLPLAWLVLFFGINGVIKSLEVAVYRPWNRYLRSRNIARQGWPPPHLDADGDFNPDPP